MLAEALFTKTFVGATTFTFEKNDGIEALSIKCTSSTPITFKGTRQIRGFTSDFVSLGEQEVFTFTSSNGQCEVEIVIPAGATCEVTAY